MSSAGQAIGYVLGAVVGYFTGGLSYVALGSAVGGAIGGALDPPKGPKIVGPRLDDLSVQTSTYGAPLGRAYGTVAVTGNIFWLEGDALKEHTKTEKQGGKGGGGGAESTTYSYSATFAVGLLHITDPAQTVTLRRLWIDTTLVFDGSATNTDSTIASIKGIDYSVGGIVDATAVATASAGYDISGDSEGVSFTFFGGTDDQIPHPRIQADKGAANVSGYPGLCYIVIEDLDLSKYSNTLMRAQVKAELSISPATSTILQKVADLPWASGGDDQFTLPGTIFTRAWGCEYTEMGLRYSDNRPMSVETYKYTLGEGRTTTAFRDLTSDHWDDGFCVFVQQSDVQCAVFIELTGPFGTAGKRVNIVYPSVTYRGPDIAFGDFATANYYAVMENGVIYAMSYGAAESIGLFTVIGGEVGISSGVSDRLDAMGYSSSYIFCARKLTAPGRTVLTRYNKTTLSVYDQSTFSGLFFTAMQVIDDDHAYFSEQTGHVYEWSSGRTPTYVGQIVQTQANFGVCSFFVVNNSYAVSSRIDYKVSFGTELSAIYLGALSVQQQSATLHDIVTAECAAGGIDSSDLDLTALTNSGVRGYRIAAPSSIRSALEPLQAAFPFDVAQSSYKLRFVSRGGASVASIPENDLGASDGKDKSVTLLPIAREMDSQIHSRVSVRYIDPVREYDTGEQYADRPETASVSEWVNDLPIVMTGSEAAQVADILLSKEWVERREFGPFSLPPTWLALEPADVIAVDHRGQSYTLRLTRIEYAPDGRLTCWAKQTAAASYVSTATGYDPIVVGQSVVALKGSTSAYLMDIPRVRSEQDACGLAFGLLGKASGWPGGILLRSDDSGNNWVSCGALNTRAAVFTASVPLSSHNGYSPDFSSLLTVTPETPGAALYSVTEEQFYSESNLAAYGVDGRWELLAFRTATSSSGTFIVKDFLRGLYGSEANTALHSSGDLFIVIDTATIAFSNLQTNALGVPRLYRPVTQGGSSGSSNDITNTYGGINLKPLSPVDLNGERLVGVMDWHLGWTRRTRWPVEVFSGSVVPLEEAVESYDLEIYSDGTFNTIKRSFNSLLSASATYTEAQQLADFAVRQDTLYVKIYQLSPVVGRGAPLIQSIYIDQFSHSAAYDDAVLALSPALYLKMDNATNAFVDSSTTEGHGTGTSSGITYMQPGLLTDAWGNCVNLTSGASSGCIEVPNRAGFNGAFTALILVKFSSLADPNCLFHHGDSSLSGSQGYLIEVNDSGCVYVKHFDGSTWQTATGAVSVCAVGVTSWLAFTYNDATTFKIYKDGAFVETLTLSSSLIDNAQALIVGGAKTTGSLTGYINANIDEVAWFDSVLSDSDISNLFDVS